MKGRDEIKELFSDKLGNFEAQVRPDMWANIASQIGGTTTSVASSGLSLLSKTFIGIGIGAAVVTTVLLVIPSENTPIEKGNPINRTSSTNIEEKVAPIDLQISDETVKESIVLQKQTNIPADVRTEPLVNKEIDQDQNFRSNVSLINTQKETGVKYTKEDKNIIEKEKAVISKKDEQASTKVEVVKENNVDEQPTKQPEVAEKTYSLDKLPNIFTPNGDGSNDILSISSEGLIDFTIVVLDDKQKVVFESNNPDFSWDGTDKGGNKVKAGTYVYYIIAQDTKGNKVNKFTSLQIVF